MTDRQFERGDFRLAPADSDPAPHLLGDHDEDPKDTSQIDTPTTADDERPASLWGDAWRLMRRNPFFWISAAFIVLFITMAAFPQLFTAKDPYFCDLNMSRVGPGAGAIFGYDLQGCDVYARTIYGARSSILVGSLATLATLLIGATLGVIAGFAGGWLDTLLSRLADVFFAIPLLLGAIIIMFTWRSNSSTPYLVTVMKVVLALSILGWPSLFRLMRSSVLQVKPQEYVQAARALGASPLRIITSHIVPNALAPVIVVATIDLGAYIASEATLSYLGIGLQAPVISWGIAISDGSGLGYIANAPHMLLFPSLFLSLTVLAFILLGEVIRDALDPKLR